MAICMHKMCMRAGADPAVFHWGARDKEQQFYGGSGVVSLNFFLLDVYILLKITLNKLSI